MEFVTRYLWVVLVALVLYFFLRPESKSPQVLGELGKVNVGAIKALQGR